MFMPLGAPILLAPLLVSIELVSYLARPVSLGLRLAANITSGHILLGIIALFIHKMILAGGFLLIASLGAISILLFLSVLELGVALIQAYVFTLLVSLYYNDAVHLH
jgi:ATP synthase subunit 6